jgi:hypothetical protein
VIAVDANEWRDAEAVWVPLPTARHRNLLGARRSMPGVRANDLPDADLAALAIGHGPRLATSDGGFARSPALTGSTRWADTGRRAAFPAARPDGPSGDPQKDRRPHEPRRRRLDAFVVRKQANAHGLQRRVDGPDIAGAACWSSRTRPPPPEARR